MSWVREGFTSSRKEGISFLKGGSRVFHGNDFTHGFAYGSVSTRNNVVMISCSSKKARYENYFEARESERLVGITSSKCEVNPIYDSRSGSTQKLDLKQGHAIPHSISI